MAAKKKEASVIGGREEVIDRGLFGEGAALSRDPEDTITRVAKSNPYAGKRCLILASSPGLLSQLLAAGVWYHTMAPPIIGFFCMQVNRYLMRANIRAGSLLK